MKPSTKIMSKQYYVYIITNKYNTVFYTGVTNNLPRRIYEHKNKLILGFTSRYNIWKLIYYEEYAAIDDALNREKQVKDYRREKKLKLIKEINNNLSEIEI
ncbi:MAG TPA: GIY-YIG nuclease family protein [Candidatus Saccharimonadales bacterium]|nr:GIY-YIG nuclease family protein [Candidatus Saccharimonadales bacterium]